jgi:hypothetical protein
MTFLRLKIMSRCISSDVDTMTSHKYFVFDFSLRQATRATFDTPAPSLRQGCVLRITRSLFNDAFP